RRVDVAGQGTSGLVAIRIGEYLIGPLAPDAIQRSIRAGEYSEIAARQLSVNPRHSPSRGQGAQRWIGKLRRFTHSHQIEDVPPVRIAIAAIQVSVVGIQEARTSTRARPVRVAVVADAMGQGVIPTDGHAVAGAALNGKQQGVVTLGAAIIEFIQNSDRLSVLRPLQTQPAALVRVVYRGAYGVADPVEHAWRQSQIDGRIQWL